MQKNIDILFIKCYTLTNLRKIKNSYEFINSQIDVLVTHLFFYIKKDGWSIRLFYNFILKDTLCFSWSKLITFTFTISPTDTTSDGFFMYLSDISDI